MRPSLALTLTLLAFSPSAFAQAARPTRSASAERPPRTPPSIALLSTQGPVILRDREGAPRDAHGGEALTRGTQITVGSAGYALLGLPNGVTLALLPDSRLTAYENPLDRRDQRTTLEAGTARVASPASVAQTFTLSTVTATLYLGHGDGVVRVLPSTRATRISTHQGTLRARFAHGALPVTAGRGVSIEAGRQSRPRELLAAPAWVDPPPREAATSGAPVSVAATFAATGPRRVARWRVEVARDEAFQDIVSVSRATAAQTRWEVRDLARGTYFVRVVAMDSDHYESPPSIAARTVVRGAEVEAGSGDDAELRVATVRVPEGLSCGLDGAPLNGATRSIRLSPARAHRLRCAARSDGSDAVEREIPATESGPLQHGVRVQQTNWGEGIVTVRLTDAEGYGVPYANISMSSGGALNAEPMREATERGVYRASIFWRGRFPSSVTLRFTVNGAVSFEAPVVQPEGILAAVNR